MDIQLIFDTVIASGHYGTSSKYMCIALANAQQGNVISKKQYTYAISEIEYYLRGHSTLKTALELSGHPASPTDCLRVWLKWSFRRPKITWLR